MVGEFIPAPGLYIVVVRMVVAIGVYFVSNAGEAT